MTIGGHPHKLLGIQRIPGIKQQGLWIGIGETGITMLIRITALKRRHPGILQSRYKGAKIFGVYHEFIPMERGMAVGVEGKTKGKASDGVECSPRTSDHKRFARAKVLTSLGSPCHATC